MSQSLEECYERALLFLEETKGAFARSYPAEAGGLMAKADIAGDPHLERMIEACGAAGGPGGPQDQQRFSRLDREHAAGALSAFDAAGAVDGDRAAAIASAARGVVSRIDDSRRQHPHQRSLGPAPHCLPIPDGLCDHAVAGPSGGGPVAKPAAGGLGAGRHRRGIAAALFAAPRASHSRSCRWTSFACT